MEFEGIYYRYQARLVIILGGWIGNEAKIIKSRLLAVIIIPKSRLS